MIAIILSIVFVLTFDAMWITLNYKTYYDMYSNVQGKPMKVNIYGALLSYLCIFLLFLIFIVPRIDKAKTLIDYAKETGSLGLLVYGVYNFTNLALFEKYSLKTAMLDTLWGGILFTLVPWIISKLI